MISGPETYKAIAEALPYEVQSALLSIRDNDDDQETQESLYQKTPVPLYCALIELCLVKDNGGYFELTTAGRHLVDFCTC